MTPRRKRTDRTTIGDALSEAQARRTQGRLAWIDALVDSLIAVFPDKRTDLEAMRIDLHTTNETYVALLNDADLALINRVSAMLLNAQLDREEQRSGD